MGCDSAHTHQFPPTKCAKLEASVANHLESDYPAKYDVPRAMHSTIDLHDILGAGGTSSLIFLFRSSSQALNERSMFSQAPADNRVSTVRCSLTLMLICLKSPIVNPLNGKAQQLPLINPVDKFGRIYFFSWFAFCVSFLAWYALPPLLTRTIRMDLDLSEAEIADSNIVALLAGLLVRLSAGPLCDRYGPRLVIAGLLWASAIPCAMAATITSVEGLYAIRFFVGIAGGTFVPAQVWIASFFDAPVLGTSTGFAAGWGDAGVGLASLLMPVLYEVASRTNTVTVSWRLTFILPSLLLVVTGVGCLLLCDDSPSGPWADRHFVSSDPPPATDIESIKLDGKGGIAQVSSRELTRNPTSDSATLGCPTPARKLSVASELRPVVRLGIRKSVPLLASMQVLMVVLPYVATFGGALVVNSILVSIYLDKFSFFDQEKAGEWAAMFGLLNFVTRPAGGLLSDLIARRLGPQRGIHGRKFWCAILVVLQGVVCLVIGLVDPSTPVTLILSLSFLAIFMEAGNGACYALVPFINPEINGLLGGFVGAAGNLGGIIFSTMFRFTSVPQGFWIIGIVSIVFGFAMMTIHPVPVARRESIEHTKAIDGES